MFSDVAISVPPMPLCKPFGSALSSCHHQLSPELESVGFDGDTEDHSDGGGLRNS